MTYAKNSGKHFFIGVGIRKPHLPISSSLHLTHTVFACYWYPNKAGAWLWL